MCEFNNPRPDRDRRRGVARKEMGFPRCVGFGEGDLERMEQTAGEGQDWKAVRERLGEYTCINAYWCRGEEVPWPEE